MLGISIFTVLPIYLVQAKEMLILIRYVVQTTRTLKIGIFIFGVVFTVKPMYIKCYSLF